jgi:tRNA modification GTPase
MLVPDTIAAIATAPGIGAIALLRLSGPQVREISSRVLSKPLADPRLSVLRNLVTSDSEIVDQVLATYFPAPHSYTGEDVLELACHGGVLVTRRVLETLLAAGARSAGPGEFSQRAFLNGKLDLTQAEAVMDLISAQTTLALRAAQHQLEGRLGRAIHATRDELLGILAHLEAYIDFPEEDIDPATGAALRDRMEAVRDHLDQLLATAEQGRILRQGARTVICGPPNAGKSSLLNFLLGFERAIVSEIPGTTRDTIEEVINLRGLPLRLIDTAGIRETDDIIEQHGVTRSTAALASADLILVMVDASQPDTTRVAIPAEATRHRLLVLNKADLGVHPNWQHEGGMEISCTTGIGMDALSDRLFQILTAEAGALGADLVSINARHQDCLQRARTCLLQALTESSTGASAEFIALEVRSAMDAVGDVVGRLDTEDLLGEIFSSFCIGK